GLTHLFAAGGGVGGGSLQNSTCTSSGDPSANVRLNCDSDTSPENETPITTDPTNPNHLLAGSNDYSITIKGSGTQERVPTGFFTSFDGGQTWTDGQIPMGNGGSGGNGDPSPAFDAKFGTAHMAQLSAAIGQGRDPNAGHIDVSVSTSYDGGLTWKSPVTVDIGQASIGPSANGVFLDKEWLVADNNPSSPHYGRLYLTWDRIMTVTSHDGGLHFSNPVHVADMEDGGIEGIKFTDYPANVDGRATQTGFQFRTGSWGNLGLDPVTGKVYVVWTDNSDGAHDVPNPVTDTNVFMSVSSDEGATWSAPIRVTSGPTDKWFPWVAARGGEVGVVYQEEAVDGSGTYVTNVATSTNDGASWSRQTVSNAGSDADHSVWFQAHAPDCATCSRFIGDYIGAAFDTLGRIHITWTDMRRDLSIPALGRTGKAEDDMYAQR